MPEKQVTIFSDGASRGNPGRGGWGSVLVYPDSHDVLHVDELGGREDMTTNNRMEISAVAYGLAHMDGFYEKLSDISFVIYTDSSYVLKGATQWIKGWKKNDWKTATKDDVKNRDLWEMLSNAMEGKRIVWKLVPGHAGVPGNERCDVIATELADKINLDLYKGKLSEYSIKNILNIPDITKLEKKKKSSSSKVAYSYVSVVDGHVETHKTWADCEARVKGTKGARFKKVFSAGEESNLKKEFSNS